MKATLLPRPDASAPKASDAWFADRARIPGAHEASGDALLSGWQMSSALPSSYETFVWSFAGPSSLGGRLTCLAVHPKHPNTIYAGAAGGGVWRSSDAGMSWEPFWDQTMVMQIGALAIDPQVPSTVFCGTGEANRTTGSYNGNGIYCFESADRGWGCVGGSTKNNLPRRISAIAIDPFDSKHVLLGGVAVGDDDPAGIFSTFDGGNTWRKETFAGDGRQMCHAVNFHPTKKGVVFAAIEDGSHGGGIWRFSGKDWTQLTDGLPAGSKVGRSAIAIGASDPSTVYAVMVNTSKRLLGVFRSRHLGDKWEPIHGTEFDHEHQLAYNLCIAVHPGDSDTVMCGMTNLHRSTDGGKSWKKMTQSKDSDAADYVHADHHAIVILQGGRIYSANDGGFATSPDGKNWETRNSGLGIAMFYTVDVAPADGNHYGGGCQDIETVVTETGNADDFNAVIGGDGAWLVYGHDNPVQMFGSFQQVGVFRHSETENWVSCSPDVPDEERRLVFLTYLAIDHSDPKTVFTGTTRIWRTKDAGATWAPVSPVLDKSVVTAISISVSDPRRVYAATTAGGFFRSVDGGHAWSANLAATPLPQQLISAIAVDPTDPDFVIVTIGLPGFVAQDGSMMSHVFLSKDGGKRWSDIDRGKLPNIAHTAVEIRSDKPSCIYVASHCGVHLTRNLGETWISGNGDLPWVPIMDLVYHEKDRTLTAATYGRGLWRMMLS